MNTIWKFPLCVFHEKSTQPKDSVTIELPEGAQLHRVQTICDKAYLFATVDPEAPKAPRTLRILKTGELFDQNEFKYLDTVQFHGGGTVLHLFESLKTP
jgi:hypothetical protein